SRLEDWRGARARARQAPGPLRASGPAPAAAQRLLRTGKQGPVTRASNASQSPTPTNSGCQSPQQGPATGPKMSRFVFSSALEQRGSANRVRPEFRALRAYPLAGMARIKFTPGHASMLFDGIL